MKHLRSAVIIAVATIGSSAACAQDEVSLIAPGTVREAIKQLIPGFESKTGHKVKATFGSIFGTKRQVTQGEPFDVPIVASPYPEVLASGNVVDGSAKPLTSVAVGLFVRKGASKPDISTPEAVKKMLLSAKSISSHVVEGSAPGLASRRHSKSSASPIKCSRKLSGPKPTPA